jgi:hypothetical protein
VGSDPSAGDLPDGRRGRGRAAVLLALALVASLAAAAGCGGSGHGAETNPEKGSDAAILNTALGRELTLLGVYTHGRRFLRGRERAVGRRLRAQEREYVDALTKALRGLGGDADGEAEEVELSGVKGEAGFLALAAEMESAAVDFYVGQAAKLYTTAPRTLDAWLAAGHGQHVGLLPPGGG